MPKLLHRYLIWYLRDYLWARGQWKTKQKYHTNSESVLTPHWLGFFLQNQDYSIIYITVCLSTTTISELNQMHRNQLLFFQGECWITLCFYCFIWRSPLLHWPDRLHLVCRWCQILLLYLSVPGLLHNESWSTVERYCQENQSPQKQIKKLDITRERTRETNSKKTQKGN